MKIKIPKITSNFFFISAALLLVWMIFFDSNDLLTQYKRTAKINDLEDKKEFYQAKITEVEKDREELLSDDELLEKYAREKYLMRKKNEDLYIIVED